MPPKSAVIRNGVYVDTAASLEVSDSLLSQRISLVPNLTYVIEHSSIIDGRAIQRPTAPRYKRAWRGAAVEEGKRLSE
jgi:hypothetical protein